MKTIVTKVALFMVTCTLLFMAGCSSFAANDTVRIGHQDYTEQRIVGQLFSVYLESKGYKTEMSEYPSTWLIFNALENGDIDVYGDYTGSAYGAILDQSKALSKDETYNYVKTRFEKDYGITLLKPLGWNNNYVLSVTPKIAEKYRLNKISDIIPLAGQMALGSDAEFAYRKDGLSGLIETYNNLKFKSTRVMDEELLYQALNDREIDITASYSTDARIQKFGLVSLIDDKSFFPPYYVTPIIKMDFAEKNHKLVADLEALENQWTEVEIKQYNLMVDEGQDPRAVAEMMLHDKGLI